MKKIRQKAILDLVRGQEVASQEELLEGLLARKIEVSQSTLSRDIQELGLAKSGGVYTVMGSEPPRSSDEAIRRTIREFLTDVALAQNIVVLKSGPAMRPRCLVRLTRRAGKKLSAVSPATTPCLSLSAPRRKAAALRIESAST